jgi:Na+/melibiose symporter-like transporter
MNHSWDHLENLDIKTAAQVRADWSARTRSINSRRFVFLMILTLLLTLGSPWIVHFFGGPRSPGYAAFVAAVLVLASIGFFRMAWRTFDGGERNYQWGASLGIASIPLLPLIAIAPTLSRLF